MTGRYRDRWIIGEWVFYEMVDHGFTGPSADKPLYGYSPIHGEGTSGQVRVNEWYGSLDHAMVAAVAEKYTGPRGAGGTGVGTAADWFMRMIGADQLRPGGAEARTALDEALKAAEVPVTWKARRKLEDELEVRGFTVARHPA
jgi:hypothetical protein